MKSVQKTLQKNLAVSVLSFAAPLATSMTAQAAEMSANVSVATDYTFRGVSQTDEKGAIQGGFDAEFDRGFYLGVWASNVNFGPASDTSTEINYYVGWSREVADGLVLDVSTTYFVYDGDSALNYPEYGASLAWMGFTAGLFYSNDYAGEDTDFHYPYLGYKLLLPQDFTLSFHVGHNRTDERDFFDEGKKSYWDWSVGLAKAFKGVELGLTYVDTDLNGIAEADARVILSLSKSF